MQCTSDPFISYILHHGCQSCTSSKGYYLEKRNSSKKAGIIVNTILHLTYSSCTILLHNESHAMDLQVDTRLKLTNFVLLLGIIFWSFIVTFIITFGNLNSLAKTVPFLETYVKTGFYKALNSYIASSILLIFLGLLPLIFDSISRYYEGIKVESIQAC